MIFLLQPICITIPIFLCSKTFKLVTSYIAILINFDVNKPFQNIKYGDQNIFFYLSWSNYSNFQNSQVPINPGNT